MTGAVVVDEVRPSDLASAARAPTGTLILLWVMLLVSVVSWRTGAFYAGGLDPVVVAKAALSTVSLLIAFVVWSHSSTRRSIGVRTVAIVGSYLIVTTLGAWSAGSLLPSAVLVVRVSIIALTIILVVSSRPMLEAITTLTVAMAIVGSAAAVTGLSSIASGGRLTGGVLPVNSNQIAMLFGPPTLFLLWRLLRERGGRYDVILAVVFAGLTWLTGSRMGLLALLVAGIIMVLQARPLPVGAFVACVAAIPVVCYLVLSTGLLTGFFERGGSENIATLSSRTIAWQAAFEAPADFWQHWFGGGLAVKTVGVTGTYWDTQVLDSSWVSAFVQGGVLGLILLALWAFSTLGAAARTPAPWRMLWTSFATYAILRSTLESGLIDAYVLFIIMFATSVAVERPQRELLTPLNGLARAGNVVPQL